MSRTVAAAFAGETRARTAHCVCACVCVCPTDANWSESRRKFAGEGLCQRQDTADGTGMTSSGLLPPGRGERERHAGVEVDQIDRAAEVDHIDSAAEVSGRPTVRLLLQVLGLVLRVPASALRSRRHPVTGRLRRRRAALQCAALLSAIAVVTMGVASFAWEATADARQVIRQVTSSNEGHLEGSLEADEPTRTTAAAERRGPRLEASTQKAADDGAQTSPGGGNAVPAKGTGGWLLSGAAVVAALAAGGGAAVLVLRRYRARPAETVDERTPATVDAGGWDDETGRETDDEDAAEGGPAADTEAAPDAEHAADREAAADADAEAAADGEPAADREPGAAHVGRDGRRPTAPAPADHPPSAPQPRTRGARVVEADPPAGTTAVLLGSDGGARQRFEPESDVATASRGGLAEQPTAGTASAAPTASYAPVERLYERRAAPRIPYVQPGRMRWRDGEVAVSVLDLSESGLRCEVRAAPGARAPSLPATAGYVKVTFPLSGEQVTLPAQVAWVRASPDGVQVGLQFLQLGVSEAQLLRATCLAGG
jgi:hypothetical protein